MKGEKTGGRTKGTPNKKTQSLMDMCEKMEFNPFQALLKMAKDHPEDEMRFQATKEVCQYLYAKRKSLEHSANIDPKILEAAEEVANLNKEQQIELLEQELKKLKGTT